MELYISAGIGLFLLGLWFGYKLGKNDSNIRPNFPEDGTDKS